MRTHNVEMLELFDSTDTRRFFFLRQILYFPFFFAGKLFCVSEMKEKPISEFNMRDSLFNFSEAVRVARTTSGFVEEANNEH